ncbi:MAG: hypothetical protein HY833_01205 [Candidatus Aenigmarchaeota archaeon]|nr:hypothetical protein [Candidatus Aenigmarchaeota archaeon]
MATLEEIVSEISRQSDTAAENVNSLIEDKLIEFSNMITKEAAAHLVARDLDAKIETAQTSKFQIKNLVSGVRNVNLVARVFKTSPITEFQKKNGEKGRVVNVFLSDGSGYTRLPLWNDQVKIIEDGSVKVGDVVQVYGGMSKDNVYGEVEISIGKFGSIRKVDDDSLVPGMEDIGQGFIQENPQTKISGLVPGNFDVRGTIVQVFKGNFIFESDGGDKAMFISCLLDDGTGDIRTVFFRGLAEQLSGTTAADLDALDLASRHDVVKKGVLGKEIMISGKVKNNSFFNTLEMVADSVEDINPIEESKRLVEELEAKIGV